MRYRILSSGSKGNALYVEEGSLRILIDCGVAYSKVKSVRPHMIFLTHEHTDHLKLKTVKKLLDDNPLCKVIAGPHLWEKMAKSEIYPGRVVLAVPGKTVNVTVGTAYKVDAEPFELIHDVPNYGWKLTIESPEKTTTMMYATDTASIDHIELPELDYYFVEANYEDEEIEKRIAEKVAAGEFAYEYRARENHLSKAQTDKWLAENAGENSTFIYMHQHGGCDE